MAHVMRGQVVRETEKYVYTVETFTYSKTWFFVDFVSCGKCMIYGETLYATEEEAKQNIEKEMEGIFQPSNPRIRHETRMEHYTIRHRYKKG